MDNNDSGNGSSPNNNMQGANESGALIPADQQPTNLNPGLMVDRSEDDGFVVINQALNQVISGAENEAGADAHKPEFGPNASKILAPMVQDISRSTGQGPAIPQNFDTHVVLMKGITWSRDSHGLFDYESRHLTKKTLKATYAAMIMRSGNELSLQHYNSERSFQEQFNASKKTADDMAMLKIVNHNKDTFYLESAAYQHHANDLDLQEQNGKLQESMYLVVRSLKINNEKIDYEIKERDILKIGRVKFAVKEIGYANQQMDVDSQDNHEKGHSANSIFTDTNEEDFEEFITVPATMQDMSHIDPERKCRFCWITEASEENPLLGTCKCAGSVGQIHYGCLSAWLQTRQQSKTSQNFSTFFWKAFECEICKTAYPLMMKAEGKVYNLVKHEKPVGDYMVLESLSQEKNTSRIIHIIRPSSNKTVFKLGRGHESDLRINDISVSRCHTKIKFEKGKFLLEDNQSKFGTLVLVKQRTPLLPGYNKAVQVGRTVINFSVKHLQKPDASTSGIMGELATEGESIPHQDAGPVGVVKINQKPTGVSVDTQPSRGMVRRPSEREMPSAEQMFQDQLGSNANAPSAEAQQQQMAQTQHTHQSAPINAQDSFPAAHDNMSLPLPEDVQLQMALQASMQMATQSQGQAQGNPGDQDSVNNGANEADE